MRKFRTEPVTARVFHQETVDELYGRIGGVKGDRWVRGLSLLAHWWAVGHSPARNVTTCRVCHGKWWPHTESGQSFDSCIDCQGTGKAVKL